MKVLTTPKGIYTMEEGLSQAWLKSLSDDEFQEEIDSLKAIGDVDEAAKLRAMRPHLMR